MNAVQTWLWLIGTPERAKKLRVVLEHDVRKKNTNGRCPSEILFGQAVSRKLYAYTPTQVALDAWDTEEITKEDLIRFCLFIESGKYTGPVYNDFEYRRIKREINERISPYASLAYRPVSSYDLVEKIA